MRCLPIAVLTLACAVPAAAGASTQDSYELFAVDGFSLFTINLHDGSFERIGPCTAPSLIWDPIKNILYGECELGVLCEIDRRTGNATPAANTYTYGSPVYSHFTKEWYVLFGSNQYDNYLYAYPLGSNGLPDYQGDFRTLTPAGDLGPMPYFPCGLTADDAGYLWTATSFGGPSFDQGFIEVFDPYHRRVVYQVHTGHGFLAIAVHPETGEVYGIDDSFYPDFQLGKSNLEIINPRTGKVKKVIGQLQIPWNFVAITFAAAR
jgi:hypothetical protein